MTNEEAIYILKNTAWLGTDNGAKVYPAIEKAIEALEKAEKYKKHDLRKNPEDLPKDFHAVFICIKGFEGKQSSVLKAVHSKRQRCWGTESFRYKDDEVTAWREIEPFEED